MNKIFSYGLLLLTSLSLLASCSDDTNDNPTLRPATEFQLNTPPYSQQLLDLKDSDGMRLTWSQPNFGFPIATSYQLQVSLTNSFTTSVAEADADKTKQTKADYTTLDDVYYSCANLISAPTLARCIQEISHWKPEEVPTQTTIQMRMMAYVQGEANTFDTIYSNVIDCKVIPYYIELRPADPELWYLIGSCVGNGSWGNDPANIGVALQPLYIKAGATYHKKTGKGIIEYVGYFPAHQGFKILKTPGDWNNFVFCKGAEADTPWLRTSAEAGDPGNIEVAESGYYRITINTAAATPTCKIEKLKEAPSTIYPSIFLTGDFNQWEKQTKMQAIATFSGAQNHDWTSTHTFTNTGNVRFTPTTGVSWGSAEFPYGVGVQKEDATKIFVEYPGEYKIFFNDITGAYSFVMQK